MKEFSKESLRAARVDAVTVTVQALIKIIQEEVTKVNGLGFSCHRTSILAWHSTEVRDRVVEHFEKLGMVKELYRDTIGRTLGGTMELEW